MVEIMTPTSTRLLRLLSLLQSRPQWTGTELAERLDVSGRTVRHDMARLREMGYAIDGVQGSGGGYRLMDGGSALPPLMLDADEAIAIAIGLRTGVNCIIGGMEETALQALTKVERALPARHRQQVRNLGHYTVPLPGSQPVPVVDPALLTLITNACSTRQRIRFEYDREPDWPLTSDDDTAYRVLPPSGRATQHDVEPYLLINRHHHWLLLGFCRREEDWQIYLVSGLRPRTPPWGPRFTPRPLSEADLQAYVTRRLPGAMWEQLATVTFEAPADQIRARLASAEGIVEEIDDRSCSALLGGESLNAIAVLLARLDVDFTIEDPPELAEHASLLAERLLRRGTGQHP